MSGCQAATGRISRGEPDSAGGQLACPVSPVLAAWRAELAKPAEHPITPLSAKLTIDSESVRELVDTTP
jgi:hypothetical protein